MICTSCGAEMEAGAHFCPSCGATVSRMGGRSEAPPAAGQGVYRGSPSRPWIYPGAPVAAAAGRVSRNLRPLATLWLVYAGIRAFGGVVGLLVVTAIGAGHYGPLVWMVGSPVPRYLHSPAWLGFAVPAVIMSTLIACGLALATGLALLQAKPWGRIVALIAAVLALFKFPLGTALGVYTLWALAPSRSAAEYDQLVKS